MPLILIFASHSTLEFSLNALLGFNISLGLSNNNIFPLYWTFKDLKGSTTSNFIPPASKNSFVVISGLPNIKPILPSGR